jgi:hypothetical protein
LLEKSVFLEPRFENTIHFKIVFLIIDNAT